MTSAAAQALFDELERGDPQRWAPATEGERIAGRFVRISAGRTRYAEVAPVMTIADDETGTLVEVWLNQIALREKIFKAKPQRGELVALIYDGKHTPRGGGDDYHAFRVLVERAAGALVDWEAVAHSVQSQTLSRSWYRHAGADESDWSSIDDYAAVGESGAEEVNKAAGTDATAEAEPTASRYSNTPPSPPTPQPGTSHAPPIEQDGRRTMPPCEHCGAPFPHHEPGCTEEIPF